ncbi:Hypothetical protein CINCED_3A007357 [Cinara cedri]|uniref:Uncharacterized protein n=1 Tax=Cinara cedri TaxID=506608 RepID=A0A5E4NE44_9HEMI|nr:Hypothetical protein CINCED_3A007357 [Cinara cedri]
MIYRRESVSRCSNISPRAVRFANSIMYFILARRFAGFRREILPERRADSRDFRREHRGREDSDGAVHAFRYSGVRGTACGTGAPVDVGRFANCCAGDKYARKKKKNTIYSDGIAGR